MDAPENVSAPHAPAFANAAYTSVASGTSCFSRMEVTSTVAVRPALIVPSAVICQVITVCRR